MKVRTATTTMDFQGSITKAEMQSFLDDIPSDASIRVTHHPGDQRDPSYTTLAATWRIGRAR